MRLFRCMGIECKAFSYEKVHSAFPPSFPQLNGDFLSKASGRGLLSLYCNRMALCPICFHCRVSQTSSLYLHIHLYWNTWLREICSYSVRNIQGNRINSTQANNKELAHVITEARKSRDMQSTSWDPRRADHIVSVQVKKPENKKRQYSGLQSMSETKGRRRRVSLH